MSEEVKATTTYDAVETKADGSYSELTAPYKKGAWASERPIAQDYDDRIADERAHRRPDRNLRAAIWTIVCGVALPCQSS